MTYLFNPLLPILFLVGHLQVATLLILGLALLSILPLLVRLAG